MDFINLARQRIIENIPKLSETKATHGGIFIARVFKGKNYELNAMVSEQDAIFVLSSNEFSDSGFPHDNYIILKNLLEDNGFNVITSTNLWLEKLAS